MVSKSLMESVVKILAEASSIPASVVMDTVEVTPDPTIGDVSSALAFVIAKENKKDPIAAASALMPKIEELIEKDERIRSCDMKGAFINFFLN